MIINRKICSAGLKNNPNKLLTAINYITIHCTGNYAATAGAKNHADYIYNGSGGSQVSWHYTIDSREIWQHFEDNQACWHAADSIGNSTSIGLEICVNDKAAFRGACENAAWLTAELLKRHGLTIDKVVQHNKWSGKDCPAELRSGAWGVTWSDFIAMVSTHLTPSADASAEQVRFNKMMDEYLRQRNTLPVSGWADEYWTAVCEDGIMDGSAPLGFLTREQAAALICRLRGLKTT